MHTFNIKSGEWYRFRGGVKLNARSGDYEFGINDMETYNRKKEKRTDNSIKKRVELHLHTNMSQMDGLIPYKKLLKKINDFSMTSVAVTDKNAIQVFPKLYKHKGNTKILFGCELSVVDDENKIILGSSDKSLYDEIVVFDFEMMPVNFRKACDINLACRPT